MITRPALVAASLVTSWSPAKAEIIGQPFTIRLTWSRQHREIRKCVQLHWNNTCRSHSWGVLPGWFVYCRPSPRGSWSCTLLSLVPGTHCSLGQSECQHSPESEATDETGSYTWTHMPRPPSNYLYAQSRLSWNFILLDLRLPPNSWVICWYIHFQKSPWKCKQSVQSTPVILWLVQNFSVYFTVRIQFICASYWQRPSD